MSKYEFPYYVFVLAIIIANILSFSVLTCFAETYYAPMITSYPYDSVAKKIHLFVERSVEGNSTTLGYMYILYTPQESHTYTVTLSSTFYGYGLISLMSPT